MYAERLASNGAGCNASSQNAAQLRRVLDAMFPHSYIKLYHQPPQSVCSLFNIRPSSEPSSEPSSRVQVLHLQDQLNESLVEHRAKPVGLCPIRRAIYDQCFDEIIRQVTVGCIEQGLLLFRIRNELRMTMGCYRGLYESAVGYGLNKALEAKLQLVRADLELKTIPDAAGSRSESGDNSRRLSGLGPANQVSADNESTIRLREYYESELAKKDEIISQQRAIMRALNLEQE
jgi:hypothetical protein